MSSHNLHRLIQQAAAGSGQGVFFIYHGVRVSYKQALSTSQRLAAFLRRRGVKKGDTVLLYSGNVPEFIYTLLAVLQLGAIAVPVNPAARRYELSHYCSVCSPRAVLCPHDLITQLSIDGRPFVDDEAIITYGDPKLPGDLKALAERESPLFECADVDALDPAVIIFTSAMEGEALGAMLTHAGIYTTVESASGMLLDKGDCFLTMLPLYHAFGLITSFFLPLYNRVQLYLFDKFSPRRILAILDRDSVSSFCGVPLMYLILHRILPEKLRFPGVKAWISGGEAITAGLQKALLEHHGINVRQGYGLTEASPVVTWNRTGMPNKIGSVGTAMPYNEIRIVVDGRDAEPGKEGELLVRGINVMSGYYKREDMTERFLKDGWLHTGDRGYRDEDGYVFITGRFKNLFIKKGYNVYPKEVENLLKNHLAIKSVSISGHITSDFEAITETIHATIEVKNGYSLTEQAIREWCQENISSYKIPDTIEIRN